MPFRRPCRFAAAAILVLAPVAAGHAEENRLLPFWGQPFPSGVTRREVVTADHGRDCPILLRGAGPRHRSTNRVARCPALLHARD